jgi:Leucine-rich repeat (LRR) protein
MGCAGSKGAAGGGGSKDALDLKASGVDSLAGVGLGTDDLDISDNPSLESLDGVGKLTKLVKLDANGCRLTTVPSEIERCVNLEELLVYANKIKDLPAALGTLAELTTVNLFNNQVKKMPPEMGRLAKLEEVNFAANKMMMLTDAHFASWASVKVLSLYDNNLVRMGSLAPLVALEELRMSGNNLEEAPKLSNHPSLTVYEIHKNRLTTFPDDYFSATPALQRLSIWGNQLTALPQSLAACPQLVGVQAQDNQLATIPAGPWPATLETVFLQDNPPLTKIPKELHDCCALLKRVNLGNLKLDADSQAVAADIKAKCLACKDGIFWGTDGKKTLSVAA